MHWYFEEQAEQKVSRRESLSSICVSPKMRAEALVEDYLKLP